MWVCVRQWSIFGEEVKRRVKEREIEREYEKKTETLKDEVKRNGQVKRREVHLETYAEVT